MQRLALSVDEVAAAVGCSATSIRDRCCNDTLAHLRIGDRLLILAGDVATLTGSRSTVAEDLRQAFAGTDPVPLGDVAAALGVCPRFLKIMANRHQFPAQRRGHWWCCDRFELLRWLLRERRPARWELAA